MKIAFWLVLHKFGFQVISDKMNFPFQPSHLSPFSPPSITCAIFSLQDIFLFIYQIMENCIRDRKEFSFPGVFVSSQFQSHTFMIYFNSNQLHILANIYWMPIPFKQKLHMLKLPMNCSWLTQCVSHCIMTFEFIALYQWIFFLFIITLWLTIST